MQLWVFLALNASATALALGAAVGAWRQRRVIPAALPAAVALLGLSWWCAGILAQAALPDGTAREYTVYLILPGVGAVLAAAVVLARVLAEPSVRPRRLTLVLLAVEPALITLAALGNPGNHLYARFEFGAGRPWLPWRGGPLFWLNLGYCSLLVGVVVVTLVQGIRSSSSPLQRRQQRTVLVAALIPVVGMVVALRLNHGWVAPDPVALSVLLTGLIIGYGVIRQGLLRLLPVARGLVLENVSDAVFVVDRAGRVVDLNRAARQLARQLLDDLPAELVGLPARRLLPLNGYRRRLTDGEYHLEHPDGVVDLDLRVSDLSDQAGNPLGRVVVVRDVTKLNHQRRLLADVNDRLREQLEVIDGLRHELAEVAVRDELTGLYNRRYLLAQLEEELCWARSNASPLGVIIVDLDHFKSVNDRFGHLIGDALLTATGQAMAECLRSGDTLARYGGEEFVVLLPGAGLGQAVAAADALRRRCAGALVETRHGPVSTTVSAGVATFPEFGWTSAELLQCADEALYSAKRAGRDRVVAARARLGFPDAGHRI